MPDKTVPEGALEDIAAHVILDVGEDDFVKPFCLLCRGRVDRETPLIGHSVECPVTTVLRALREGPCQKLARDQENI